MFYILNTTVFPQSDGHFFPADSEKVVYLVKIQWHTGIIFETDQVDTVYWNFIKDFKDYRYIDVGWGDADFYQHPGFNIDLAVRALFVKTQSALRIAGFKRSIKNYLAGTDYAERLVLSKVKFDSLCSYIQSSYILVNDRPVLLSRHLNGAVKFYKAKGWYTVFNTCNTWIARGLNKAGYKIDDDIVLSEQLFRETMKYGRMVKVPE